MQEQIYDDHDQNQRFDKSTEHLGHGLAYVFGVIGEDVVFHTGRKTFGSIIDDSPHFADGFQGIGFRCQLHREGDGIMTVIVSLEGRILGTQFHRGHIA